MDLLLQLMLIGDEIVKGVTMRRIEDLAEVTPPVVESMDQETEEGAGLPQHRPMGLGDGKRVDMAPQQ